MRQGPQICSVLWIFWFLNGAGLPDIYLMKEIPGIHCFGLSCLSLRHEDLPNSALLQNLLSPAVTFIWFHSGDILHAFCPPPCWSLPLAICPSRESAVSCSHTLHSGRLNIMDFPVQPHTPHHQVHFDLVSSSTGSYFTPESFAWNTAKAFFPQFPLIYLDILNTHKSWGQLQRGRDKMWPLPLLSFFLSPFLPHDSLEQEFLFLYETSSCTDLISSTKFYSWDSRVRCKAKGA